MYGFDCGFRIGGYMLCIRFYLRVDKSETDNGFH